MNNNELLPHLFRTEYRKIAAVLCKLFGIEHVEIAEDITSDTFLTAAETWGLKGIPEKPVAWLYAVAKNKCRDYLRRDKVFQQKISKQLKLLSPASEAIELDLTDQNIADSQLRMMFAICDPSISTETQVGLSLRILCGFGIDEIADAFLTNKETIIKRLSRGREKLRNEKIKLERPGVALIHDRLESVLTTIYLLFNEGYHSASHDIKLRKDLCIEAMRLNLILVDHPLTNRPNANALLSLMCFHASRFEARVGSNGEVILYDDQDRNLWNRELIERGEYYLNLASTGNRISKYHLEAGIAFWHTEKKDNPDKWQKILQLYNQLLLIRYSPMAALNRTYALSKVQGVLPAIEEAEKLDLRDYHLYHALLAELYKDIDQSKSFIHLNLALQLARSETDKNLVRNKIRMMESGK